MRNLATIQTIKSLSPIPKADKIEVAEVLGWQVVVKKGDFQVGDMCVYFELDSILPEKPWSEFLKHSDGRIERLRTVKMRGQISQGLALHPAVIPEMNNISICPGKDVTDILGITKWEPAPPKEVLQGTKWLWPKWMPTWFAHALPQWLRKKFCMPAKTWPQFLPKTDETRVQVLQPILDEYCGCICGVTEKLDGSSVTVYKKNGKIGVCSRNLELNDNGNHFWSTVKKMGVDKMVPEGYAWQGELIGPGIQGNKYGLEETTIRFFSGWDIGEQKFKDLDLMVPEELRVPRLSSFGLTSSVPVLVKQSIGKSAINPTVPREGIVVRPVGNIEASIQKDKFTRSRLSFKIINPEFLLKYEDA